MSIFSNPRGEARENAGRVVQALLDLLADRKPLDVLGETPDWLAARLAATPRARLMAPEAPGKWSVAAVIAHLADAELVIGTRSRFIVGDIEPILVGFDQDRWAAEFGYLHRDPMEALDDFTAVRAMNLRHWQRLTPTQWNRVGQHSERGPTTAELNLRIAAGHDLVHRAQVERILAGR